LAIGLQLTGIWGVTDTDFTAQNGKNLKHVKFLCMWIAQNMISFAEEPQTGEPDLAHANF